MTLAIEFDLRVDGEASPEAFLDSYELDLMFDSTRRSIGAGLRRKFSDAFCAEGTWRSASLHHSRRIRQRHRRDGNPLSCRRLLSTIPAARHADP
ncbi:MAG: hypothetical protein OXI34_12595 [Chloroflexota bacterium]|nr:hypothetical protein [Chloroflexota bacterium]MDE2948539.1 hypothetical protein [Chloroflexota bacterium]